MAADAVQDYVDNLPEGKQVEVLWAIVDKHFEHRIPARPGAHTKQRDASGAIIG